MRMSFKSGRLGWKIAVILYDHVLTKALKKDLVFAMGTYNSELHSCATLHSRHVLRVGGQRMGRATLVDDSGKGSIRAVEIDREYRRAPHVNSVTVFWTSAADLNLRHCMPW